MVRSPVLVSDGLLMPFYSEWLTSTRQVTPNNICTGTHVHEIVNMRNRTFFALHLRSAGSVESCHENPWWVLSRGT